MASPDSAQQVEADGGEVTPRSTDPLPAPQDSLDRDLFIAAIYVATCDAVRSGRSVDVKDLAKGILNAFPQSGVPIFEICEVIREATRSRVAA